MSLHLRALTIALTTVAAASCKQEASVSQVVVQDAAPANRGAHVVSCHSPGSAEDARPRYLVAIYKRKGTPLGEFYAEVTLTTEPKTAPQPLPEGDAAVWARGGLDAVDGRVKLLTATGADAGRLEYSGLRKIDSSVPPKSFADPDGDGSAALDQPPGLKMAEGQGTLTLAGIQTQTLKCLFSSAVEERAASGSKPNAATPPSPQSDADDEVVDPS